MERRTDTVKTMPHGRWDLRTVVLRCNALSHSEEHISAIQGASPQPPPLLLMTISSGAAMPI
eukprot:SAG25_NODE_389_length_8666_cov_4.431189_5_plen_62_part_00